MVRQRFAKPLYAGSNPVLTSEFFGRDQRRRPSVGPWIRRIFAVVGLTLAIAACSSSPDDSAVSSTGGNSCTPGAQIACACPGQGADGPMGAQVCAADGSGYGACEGCPGTTSSTGSGLGGAGGGASCGDGGSGVAEPYPAAPYGIYKANTFADLGLLGYLDAKQASDASSNADGSPNTAFRLGDFYEPTGSEPFPACSPFGAGMPKPKALFVYLCGVWVNPCNEMASTFLPPKVMEYAPRGVEFVGVLVEGPTQGVQPTLTDVGKWTLEHQTPYPVAFEPANTLGGVAPGYPWSVVIDPKTMKVMVGEAGFPTADDPLWAALDALVGP